MEEEASAPAAKVRKTEPEATNPYRGLFGHKTIRTEEGGGQTVVAWYGGGRSGAVFSTFYPAPFVDEEGIRFSCVEAYFQYQKAKAFGADRLAERILTAYSPSYQQRLGRQVPGFDAHKWALVQELVMREGLKLKFEQNPELRDKLLGTGDALLCQATAGEDFWACGLDLNDPKLAEKHHWPGQSKLGHLLMAIREELTSDG